MNNENQFSRIELFNLMAGDLVDFASLKYGQEFEEFVDMNCGAVPVGNFETVIDPAAPEQFLTLYTTVVTKRICLVCKKILELGEGYDKVLEKYFTDQAQKLGFEKPQDIQTAFSLIHFCVLDGIPDKKTVEAISQSKRNLVWKEEPFNAEYWKYIKAFVKGLFDGTGIRFSVTADGIFTLELA